MEEYFIVQPVNVAQSYDNICFAVTKLWSSDQLSEMDTFPLNTWWTLVAHESDQYTVYQAIIYKCHMCLVSWIHFCSFFLYCTRHLVNILLCWYFWPCCVKIQRSVVLRFKWTKKSVLTDKGTGYTSAFTWSDIKSDRFWLIIELLTIFSYWTKYMWPQATVLKIKPLNNNEFKIFHIISFSNKDNIWKTVFMSLLLCMSQINVA